MDNLLELRMKDTNQDSTQSCQEDFSQGSRVKIGSEEVKIVRSITGVTGAMVGEALLRADLGIRPGLKVRRVKLEGGVDCLGKPFGEPIQCSQRPV